MSTKVKVTEVEKASQPDKYILNPDSKKYVLRNSTQGKQIAAAVASGSTANVSFTHSAQIKLIIEKLQTHCKLTDEQIAEALAPIVQTLPSGSLKPEWGSKEKSPKTSAATGYQLFVRNVKETDSVPAGENLFKVAAEYWKNMSEAEKKVWQDKAAGTATEPVKLEFDESNYE
jgi:hypothetical protein